MLFTNPHNGRTVHIAPPRHHATPVPSAREVQSAWLTLTSTLTPKQFLALTPALQTIQRVINTNPL
jgi:hypothetical protein